MISKKFQMVSMVITKLVPYFSETKYTPSNYVGPIYPIQLSNTSICGNWESLGIEERMHLVWDIMVVSCN
jgi:hypothetical protein